MILDDRDYLAEAVAIVRGESALLPERRHLMALNDSRVFWRTSALAARSLRPMEPETQQPLQELRAS